MPCKIFEQVSGGALHLCGFRASSIISDIPVVFGGVVVGVQGEKLRKNKKRERE